MIIWSVVFIGIGIHDARGGAGVVIIIGTSPSPTFFVGEIARDGAKAGGGITATHTNQSSHLEHFLTERRLVIETGIG